MLVEWERGGVDVEDDDADALDLGVPKRRRGTIWRHVA